jgi:type VI secretion system protein ImpA
MVGGTVIRQEWLQPAQNGPACGPNLEYDQDFLALLETVRGRPEQQFGDTVIAAVEPDWADVIARATALLDRARDLRVAHCLVRGMTHLRALPGLRDGLVFVRSLLDTFWDDVHPQLEFEGEPDPLLRLNALTAFADNDGLVRDVRHAVFLRSPLGTFTIREAQGILDRNATGPAQAISPEQLRMAVRDVLVASPDEFSEIAGAIDAIDAIRALVGQRLDAAQAPDLTLLRTTLRIAGDLVNGIRAELAGAAPPVADDAAPGAATASTQGGGVGEIRSRDDAHRALEHVCDFFARHEPSNPAPLLIRRAQRVMMMPFLDIIRDLAPDAVRQVENIVGTPPA